MDPAKASQRACIAATESARRTKLNPAFALLVGLVGLCGCAHQYLMKLSDGDEIISFSKPKRQGASYHFTDSAGVKHVIPTSRVVKIRGVAVAKEEEKPTAPVSPVRTKKPKHWYFLWLA